jgi:TraX protein
MIVANQIQFQLIMWLVFYNNLTFNEICYWLKQLIQILSLILQKILYRKLLYNGNKYGANVSTLDWLKFLAIITMTIDHVGAYLLSSNNTELYGWLRSIGRIHVPIWFFFAGYSASSSSRKFDREMLWLAIILLAVNLITNHNPLPLNNLVSILIARHCVIWLNHRNLLLNKLPDITMILIFTSFPLNMLFEYGASGILYAIMGDMVRRRQNNHRFFLICLILFVFYQYTGLPNNNLWQHSFMIAGIIIYHIKLTCFKMQNINWFLQHQYLSFWVRIFSRNSLYYYAFHRALFMIAAYCASIF